MTLLYPILQSLWGLALLAAIGFNVIHALRTGHAIYFSTDPRLSRSKAPIKFWLTLVLLILGGVRSVHDIQTGQTELLAR